MAASQKIGPNDAAVFFGTDFQQEFKVQTTVQSACVQMVSSSKGCDRSPKHY